MKTNVPALPEKELVALARKGDQGAFETLLKKYERSVYNLAYRMLHNREDAADILQEAALKAYQALPSFANRSGFGTWFYRIAANQCLMKIRKKRHAAYSLETVMSRKDESGEEREAAIPDDSHNPADSLADGELRKKLEESISSLPLTYRTPFILFEVEGLPVKEIGKILNISESAVKTRLHRGRLLLREKLSGYLKHLKR